MKPRQASLLVQALLFVNGVLLTMGLARVFLTTNGLTVPFLAPLLPATLAMAVLYVLFTPPRRGLIAFCSILLATMLALLLMPERIMPIRDWLFLRSLDAGSSLFYFMGQGDMSEPLLAFTIPFITLLTAMLVHLFTVWVHAPLVPAAGLLVLMTINAFVGLTQDLPGVGLAGAAILVLLVRRTAAPEPAARRPRRRYTLAALLAAFPLIAIALVLSLALSPILPTRIGRQQQLVEGLVDDVTQMLGIPPVQSLQPDFSLEFAGYYPLENRLGGPVTLGTEPVMEVGGHNVTMLLRGAVYERYSGFTWQRDPRTETFRFDGLFQSDIRDKVFDLDQPKADQVSSGVVGNLLQEYQMTIRPLTRATSMIFTPGRPLAITPKTNDRFQVHYDEFGMLYSKYPLTQTTPYEVVSRVPATGGQLFQSSVGLALELGGNAGTPRETLYPENYLNVPALEPYTDNGELRRLAQRLTDGLDSPYDKALAIRAYLIQNATYNLDVPVPPEGREFVSWFLETREGYCIYFATAEVMLCRLAGVPARYVEGFILNQPAATGLTTVTSDLAHAWAEVYLPHIGWIPIDATPGATEPSVTDPTEPLPAEPTLAPGETTEDPLLEPEPTPLPEDQTPAEVEAQQRRYLIFFMFPMLLLAGLIMLETRRRGQLLRYPQRLREAYPDPRLRAEIYWQETQLLLNEEGLSLGNGETPITFLTRAARQHAGGEGRFAEAGRLVSRIRYSRYMPREPDLEMLAGLVAKLDEDGRTMRPVRHFLDYTILPRMKAADGRRRLLRGHFLKPLFSRMHKRPKE